VSNYQGKATIVVGGREYEIGVNLIRSMETIPADGQKPEGLSRWTGRANGPNVPWDAMLGDGPYPVRLLDGRVIQVTVERLDEFAQTRTRFAYIAGNGDHASE
jgi:hypothetical protein